ncbi:MAG: hypothetical protein IT291_06685 [Deltaproteobacteria bacterium]|nr:hypothetical protein [Deltaproteobacteria bacterium]
MDLYRYFHPQHNPRLKKVPVRLIELAELEQASTELKHALQRAQARTQSAPIGAIRDEHFSDLIIAADFIIESLSTLSKAHPGDSTETLLNMLEERRNAPGWENWASLLRQRLDLLSQFDNMGHLRDKSLYFQHAASDK